MVFKNTFFFVGFLIYFTTALMLDKSRINYCDLSCEDSAHTVCLREREKCGPASNCQSFMEFMNNEVRRYILDIHNQMRNQVALGLETRGSQPPASNMNALSYSKKLEYIAQCLTNTCQYTHDECRITPKFSRVGQNIGVKWFEGHKYDYFKTVINKTINSWYEQVASFNAALVSSYQDEKTINEYSQIVWAQTSEVGCGLTFWAEENWHSYFLACNYGPGGNVVGMPMYRIGTAATECSDDRNRNKKYKGLCGDDRVHKDEPFY